LKGIKKAADEIIENLKGGLLLDSVCKDYVVILDPGTSQ